MSKIVVGMNNRPEMTPQRIDCGFRNTVPRAPAATFNQSLRLPADTEAGSRT